MSNSFINKVVLDFEKHRNFDLAPKMSAYMKNHFPFLGIQSPLRRELYKTLIGELEGLSLGDLEMLVLQLWGLQEREYHYFALYVLDGVKEKLTPSHIEFLMDLVVRKSWWDTIDWIAPSIVGTVLKNYPDLIEEYIPIWVQSDNIWVNRTAILFQLKYKDDTDFNLMTRIIEDLKSKPDFFVKKAIGWSLREYSKTNPNVVEDYIEKANLQSLSQREGLKHILKSK